MADIEDGQLLVSFSARDDLAIYYFENKEGTAKVSPLKVDERGGVEGGLPGFYDQSLTELSDYLDALKKT